MCSGYPSSCKIGDQHQIALAREGCAAGVVDECKLAAHSEDTTERLQAMRMMCIYNRNECIFLGSELFALHEDAEATIEWERTCQYTRDARWCIRLAGQYKRNAFKEPIPGRADALFAWSCDRLPANDRFDCAAPVRGSSSSVSGVHNVP